MTLAIEDMNQRFVWDAKDTNAARRMREYRKGEAYAQRKEERAETFAWRSGHHENGRHKRLLELPICGIDGEGVTHPNGTHHYIEFNAWWPTGHHHIESESLSTAQCFEFLLSLPPGHVYVGYGLSYDTNMWVRMLPYVVIDELLDKGKAKYKPQGGVTYNLQWIERKFFRISAGGKSFTVYDVLANWQVTFVKALEAWDIGTPEQRAFIAWMKEHRKELDTLPKEKVREYCYLECELLVALCRKLFDAILETPYRPRAVYGPGALAAAALEKHGIKKYMQTPPEPVNTLTRHAYFGGRFDCAMFGWFSDIWQYDIKSAYPDQIRYLPCLTHAEWEHESAGYERIRPRKYGLYHVEWCVP